MDKRSQNPRVSIGLPVFNGDNFLREAIESILAQTYSNFELIISDNASTDQTRLICEEFSAKDDRIKYFRQERNLGAARNFNAVFRHSNGEFFKWAAHDDLIAPTYIESCVNILANDPSVVLCHSEVLAIDENAKIIGSGEEDPSVILQNANSPEVIERFKDLILIPHYCYDIFGLIRSSALNETSLIATHIGSDRSLLIELALQGRLVRLSEHLFFSRDHEARSVRAIALRDRGVWFDADNRSRITLPQWGQFFVYMKSVKTASLSRTDKLKCFSHLANWLIKNKRFLLRDIKFAFSSSILGQA